MQSNCASQSLEMVAQNFQTSVKNLRRWYREGVQRKPGCGRKKLNETAEKELALWIINESINQGKRIRRNVLKEKAIELFKDPQFKASKAWQDEFIKTHDIKFLVNKELYNRGMLNSLQAQKLEEQLNIREQGGQLVIKQKQQSEDIPTETKLEEKRERVITSPFDQKEEEGVFKLIRDEGAAHELDYLDEWQINQGSMNLIYEEEDGLRDEIQDVSEVYFPKLKRVIDQFNQYINILQEKKGNYLNLGQKGRNLDFQYQFFTNTQILIILIIIMNAVSLLIDELNDQILADQFQYIDSIGGGSQGKVVKAQSKGLNQSVAIKIIERHKNKAQDQEASLLEKCNHYNIVHFHKLLYTHNHLYIIMEYLQGITLQEVMQKQLRENKMRNLIKQILEGLSYLHNQGIIHRDLKPSNIYLVRENNKSIVKLIDLGLSYQICSHKIANKQCGTLLYMAPELAQDVPYNQTVDIFALGIIFYQLFHDGKHPFYVPGMRSSDYFKRLAKLEFNLDFKENIPSMAKDFIQKTMALSPDDRMSAYQCLDHPWIKNVEQQQYPITTNEIISTFIVKQKFITIIKALMIQTQLLQLSIKREPSESESRYYTKSYLTEIDSQQEQEFVHLRFPMSQRDKLPKSKSKMLKTVQGTFNTPQMKKREVSRQCLAFSFLGSPKFLTPQAHTKRNLKTPSPPQFRLPSIKSPKQVQIPKISNIINKSRFFQQ
ncbi:unnamed protein product (macronuclear) [Paramecium tetraurelia]|uniref:Protein kinase domain-containing protein n=1 Tax=Paramecium tetraurelia TaxID=5888 RepID=A0E1K1_PARTE|nr:uncharacterized protein GSPATT00022338001 [Paramecium tetraurelia]CAK89168.1 unnamed protein product [Paramecium tetraurelia]|eukprot:XP_001456565.1 hypothetical protein (macronuclear) [Paramecium tetraurelia strain d4-2]